MERAIQTEDDWSSAWRELAIAYGRVGRIGDSSLVLAEQFAREGKWRAAGGQAKRAQAMLPQGSPAALRQHDIEDLDQRATDKKNGCTQVRMPHVLPPHTLGSPPHRGHPHPHHSP